MIFVYMFFVVLILVILFVIMTYNGMVSKKNQMEEALSGIDIMLKKRFDLIPNLVETVKGYAQHESSTIENVIKLRNQATTSQNTGEKLQMDKQMGQALTQVFALAENYPDLKANTNFQELQNQLMTMETDIERSKRFFNGTAREYNIAIQSFPANMIANSFGFAKKDYLELTDETERQNPKVSFS